MCINQPNIPLAGSGRLEQDHPKTMQRIFLLFLGASDYGVGVANTITHDCFLGLVAFHLTHSLYVFSPLSRVVQRWYCYKFRIL
jgi:hypothetical protein